MAGDQAADVERMEFQLGLRRRGISNQTVLRAMDEVPREYFVTAEFADRAYADQALPIACGQTISQPYVVAYMTEQLDLSAAHRVLEIGTGSGYQAAVLSRIAREVVSIERYRTLADTARAKIDSHDYDAADTALKDATNLWNPNELALRLSTELTAKKSEAPAAAPAPVAAAATPAPAAQAATPEPQSTAPPQTVSEPPAEKPFFLFTPVGIVGTILGAAFLITAITVYRKVVGRANEILD